ncbi:type II toxin-antitoxin system RelE/ParE family toxin [Nitrospira sp. BLG_2]|uniref:type II toxin-antitoxin system RelE/ParE family toxin n=1 Tax=Nitrospira sp. BLG_2 TaxID=3397507 RepID=UPI003B98E6FB
MPGLPIVIHSEAVEEARAARLWYAERSQSAADSFLAELDHGIEAISESPERWPLFVHGTRRYLFNRFPFQIVYRVANERIEIVAVAHGRRRPGYWRSRE